MPIQKINTPNLIIAGLWNPDILTPHWVAKHALEMPVDQDFAVQVELPIGNPTHRPIFEFDGIRYLSAKSALTFFWADDNLVQVQKSIQAAIRILNLLSFTPITGFGFNFLYEIEEPSLALINTFTSCQIPSSFINDEEAKVVKREWRSSVDTKGSLVNVTSTYEGNNIKLKFNVHHEVSSASDASAKLGVPNIYEETLDLINCIANKLQNIGDDEQ